MTATDSHDRTETASRGHRITPFVPAGMEARTGSSVLSRAPSALDFLLGGALAGLVAGVGMFTVLAAFAIEQGRGFLYPLHAVHALMSGARVLPDYPRKVFAGGQVQDVISAPLFFFGPAVVIGVAIGWWVGHRARGGRPLTRVALLVMIATVSAASLILLVFVVGFRELPPANQRLSSGYGIRQLGVGAWLLGDAAYIAVMVFLVGPLTRAAPLLGRRRTR